MRNVILYSLTFAAYFALYHFISFEVAVIIALGDILTSMDYRFKKLKQ